MAMFLAGQRRQSAEMNVTPLVDVLLVLLIIFMLIAPTMSNGLEALIPRPPDQRAAAPADDVVLTVQGDGTVQLNQETVATANLGERLRTVFGDTPDRPVLVRAGKDLDFGQVAGVIDIAKGAGLGRVALTTR